MGYLEPRPPRPLNSDEDNPSPSSSGDGSHSDQQQLSPKQIQKQLLAKVQSLNPPDEEVVEDPEKSNDVNASSSSSSKPIPRSRSSQSLKSSGEGSRLRGLSFGNLFKRFVDKTQW